jgi:hypothetical protein
MISVFHVQLSQISSILTSSKFVHKFPAFSTFLDGKDDGKSEGGRKTKTLKDHTYNGGWTRWIQEDNQRSE